MTDLIINGKDAYLTWGVRMGEGFLDAIDTPCQMKDYIENESRLEHGKRVVLNTPKVSARQLTLSFTIQGGSTDDFHTKKKSFYEELYKGSMDIKVPANSDETYHLIYKSGTSYAQNKMRTFCKFSAKFEEPNPANRV